MAKQYPKDIKNEYKIPDVFQNPYDITLVHNENVDECEYEIIETSYCIELVLKGKNEFYHGDKIIVLTENQIQFRAKGKYYAKISKDYESILFYFNNSLLKDFVNTHFSVKKMVNSNIQNVYTLDVCDSVIKSIHVLLDNIAENNTFYPCLTKNTIEQLLLQILANDKDKSLLSFLLFVLNDTKKDLINIMNDYLFHDLSNKELAALSGRSLSSFNNEFKKVFNTTPKKWIYNKRLEKAYQLLKTTDKNITEICYDVGYKDLSHFVKTFKQKYKESPSKIKRD